MIQVSSQFFVGSQQDYEINDLEDWYVVHACKEPYHRSFVGYTTQAAPRNYEYLVARRGNRLALNLVDSDNPAYIIKSLIDEALIFIYQGLKTGYNVLVHCNRGESRGPSIGFLFLLLTTDILPKNSLENAEKAFLRIYPNYRPSNGMREFIKTNFYIYSGS